MKGFLRVLTVMCLLTSGAAMAQVAGTTTIGVAVAELDIVAKGWSAKKHILGEPVFNEKGEKVGTIHDLIVAPDRAVSYAIVGTGGFVGLAKHHVAIPVSQFQDKDGKFILAGATKAAIKALPEFEYAPSRRVSNAAQNIRERREAFEKDVQHTLEQIDRDLLALKQDLQMKSSEVKGTMQQALADLEHARKIAGQKLADLQHAESKAWAELKIGMDKAVGDLKHRLAEAKQKLQSAA